MGKIIEFHCEIHKYINQDDLPNGSVIEFMEKCVAELSEMGYSPSLEGIKIPKI